jgi:hypothetical protein
MMSRGFVRRALLVLCVLAVLMIATARKQSSGDPGSVHANTSAQHLDDAPGRPHTFSQAYDYCYVDSDGRPLMFHRRRLVFFLPDTPQLNDRTSIETDQCQ